ncbi:MAG: PKD domain-containing protein [Bacteroidia bacterium]
MKKLRATSLHLTVSCVFTLLCFFHVRAQSSIANYTVTRATGVTFSSTLPVGLPANSWRNTGAFIDDDNRSFPFDIGFDFWYDGTRFTDICVSTNGYVDFSTSNADGGPTTGPYGYGNAQFSTANGTLAALAPFYDDMTTYGGNDPLGTWIRSAESGIAPFRVLTVEWGNMAVYQNTTPSLNFQVRLHETTGQVEFHYGTMTQGTANFSYTCGINNTTAMNTPPNATQMKCQQNANTATFSNAIQNNLTQLPVANSVLRFTPPVPLNPTGTLTFTNVQAAQMTLNWTNWANNEVGYVIYNSIDGINWDFITQTALNATNATITGLFAGTSYQWKVYAVTEGALSNPLQGTQATLSGATYISVTTGNWSQANTWNLNSVPGANDNVIIANGHTVTVNINNTACHNLTIGQNGAASFLQMGNNNNARAMTIWGNVTVAANGTLRANPASNTTHTLRIYGNIVNNGVVDFQPDANSFWNLIFLHPYANQTLSGTGTTNRYNLITVDKGTEVKRILDVTTSTFTVPAGFLTLLNGTFKVSTTGAVAITPFIANEDIPRDARLWINSASATVSTTGGNINVFGILTMSTGTLNVGNLANHSIVSNGGLVTINGGTINVAGRFDRLNAATLSRLTMSAGTLVLNTIGSTSNTNAPFTMDVPGSQFIQTGGTIIIRRYGGTGATRLGFLCTGGSINQVSGGILQIGDALTPVGQIIQINTVSPVGGFRVASANATASLVTNPLIVITDVELQSGIFLTNNLNVTVRRNWSNTGGTYTAGTNTTTFNGLSPQIITRTSGAENFNHITFIGSGLKSLASNINCKNLSITSGAVFDAGTPGYLITMTGNWSNNGFFIEGTGGKVVCSGTVAQIIGGATTTTFRNLTIQNAAGVTINHHESIRGTLTLTSGMFTTTGRDFTLLSDATETARIGQITGGDITGNIIMQRYIYNGPTQWRQLGAPVTGATLQGWNDDLVTSGFPGSDYPTFSFYSVATYNEAVAGPKENGYSAPTNITNPITARKGYFVYAGPLPIPIDVQGPPLKNAQAFTLTRTVSAGPNQDGWNLVANPYPSTIDWDSPSFVRTGTDNVLQTWNPALVQYASYVGGVGVNGGTKYIPSSQAFWIHAIAANPAASIVEAVKSPVDATFMHSAQQTNVSNMLSLTLTGTMGADQSIVRFDAAATDSFDVNYDAYKTASMDTTMPYLSSSMDSVTDLTISTLGSLNSNVVVPLHVMVGISGNYFFRRDSISDLPYSTCVILEDLLNGTITALAQNTTYSCYISDTTAAIRFLLHFGPSLTTGNIAASCGSSSDGKAFAVGTGNGPWDYTWKDAAGNVVDVHNAINGTDTLYGLLPGKYSVEVNGNDGFCSFRSDTVTVNGPVPVQTGATIIPATCSYTDDGGILLHIITGGTSPYNITWPDGTHADSLQQLVPGNYDLVIADANSCIDTAHFIVGTSSTLTSSFTATPDTVIIQSLVSFSNYSNGASSYEWNFGDSSPLDSDPNPFHTYSVPGIMTITLISMDSICSDTSTQLVYVFNDVGMPEDATQGSVSVYTDQNQIGIHFNLSSVEHALIRVYDAGGNLVVEQEEFVGQESVALHMEGKAAGMYSVYILLPGKTYTTKVVLLHQ